MSNEYTCRAEIRNSSLFPNIPGMTVETYWDGPNIDRPHTSGIAVLSLQEAERLAACINAQAAYDRIQLATDRNGKTYVQARSLVWGRTLEHDLTALGF